MQELFCNPLATRSNTYTVNFLSGIFRLLCDKSYVVKSSKGEWDLVNVRLTLVKLSHVDLRLTCELR